MSSHIASHKQYLVAKLGVGKLERTIRDLRGQLLTKVDPIDYYSALADAATAEAQLDELCAQIGEWEMRSRQPEGGTG